MCVYRYREDRPLLVLMSIRALMILTFILFIFHRFTQAVL